MVERIDKRGVIVPSLIFLTISILMLTKELPLLSSHPHFSIYLWGRIFVGAAFLLCGILATFEVGIIFRIYPFAFFFLSLFYECHGQFFQSNYWLAYIQTTTIFPFIFYMDKRLLAGLLLLGVGTFDIVFYLSSSTYLDSGLFTTTLFIDLLIGTVISTVIAYAGASVFITERMKKNQIYQRFIDLGKNVSSIVHDIKGMISGPCTYVDILHQRMATGQVGDEEMQVMEYLKDDIYAVRDFVMEMNLLVSSHITDRENPVRISDVVKSVIKVFKSKIKTVDIRVIGDMTLRVKVDHLNRVLINSIINSCEAIHKNNVKNGRITIYCEKNLLGIADNSGEQLSKQTLKNLNNPYVTFTNKKEGSGIGLLLIKDHINSIGGSFKYSNHAEGVSLRIAFPKKIVLKQSGLP